MLNVITSYTLIGLLATAIWAPILISLLYKFNIVMKIKLMRNKMNEEFMKIHGHKVGTPNMGGLMISITVGVLVALLLPTSDLRNIFLIGWGLYTLYGLGDGLLVHARKLSERFKLLEASFEWRLAKFFLLLLITIVVVMLTTNYLAIDTLTLFPGLVIEVTPVSIFLGSFAMIFAIYGIEITDGADGLVTGQFIIALVAFLAIAIASNHQELLPYISLILGSAIVYLYFNINPARVFMGGPGTFPVAFALLLFALITDAVGVFIVLGFVFWVELFSSMSQIFSIRFFKRKLWRIAPIHHYFEAIGWQETKVVQRFWLASGVAAILALWLFSLMN